MTSPSCTNCAAAIKGGMFANEVVTQGRHVAFLNGVTDRPGQAYCQKCLDDEFRAASQIVKARGNELDAQRDELASRLHPLVPSVPIYNLHTLPGWSFKPLGIVSAQNVLGTGLFADVGSAITDMFGLRSGLYQNKLRAGEDLCKASLRLEALALGGNAILGVDIDYADVGGDKSMLMVCMTGTAVCLDDIGVLGPASTSLGEAASLSAQMVHIDQTIRALPTIPEY